MKDCGGWSQITVFEDKSLSYKVYGADGKLADSFKLEKEKEKEKEGDGALAGEDEKKELTHNNN